MTPALLRILSAPSLPTIAFASQTLDETDLTTYTLTQDLGEPHVNRYVYVFLEGVRSTATAMAFSSVTINGVAATPLGTQVGGTTQFLAGLFGALVPWGRTADIVVVANGTCGRMYDAVFATLPGSILLNPLAPVIVGDNASPFSQALTIPPRGFGIGFGCTNAAATFTWSGLVENTPENASAVTSSCAHLNAPTGAAPTVVATPSTNSNGHMLLAAFS